MNELIAKNLPYFHMDYKKDIIIKMICNAENGEFKIYTIITKRASVYGKEECPAESQPTDLNLAGYFT